MMQAHGNKMVQLVWVATICALVQLPEPASAQSCTRGYDIDLYPGSSGTREFGNGCSSGYCRDYSNSDCDAWHIQCSSSQYARVTFESFNTEGGYDEVYIFDGASLSYSLLATLSGSSMPSPSVYTASGSDMIVVFDTDGSNTRSGWTAEATCSSSSTPTPASRTSSSKGRTWTSSTSGVW